MLIKNVSVELRSIEAKKGTAKGSGKPYEFTSVTILDEKAERFVLTASEGVVKDLENLDQTTLPKQVSISFELYPKGYDYGARLTEIQY
jgi:hypothetical protein